MDAWQRTFDQLRTVFRGLSVAQRASLLAVSLVMLAGIGWLAFTATQAQDEFLLGGKNFSPEELSRTQAALKTAGLPQARVVGQKISVPAAEADRYTAAALAQQTLPAQFAADFDRMQAKVNVFTSTEQRRELLEEARKTRLAQILRAIPEIEDAVVEWDRPKATNLFRPAPQLAAHVSVKPRGGRELSLELVQSLKQFVAGALAGAQTDDVTVVDMNTSRVYGRRSAQAVLSERSDGLTKQHTEEYSTQIRQALRYIPEVLVSVNVELLPESPASNSRESFVGADFVPVTRRRDRPRSREVARSNHPATTRIDPVSTTRLLRDVDLEPSSERDFPEASEVDELLETETTGYRKSVQVAVSIPEGYYSAIARSRGFTPGESLVKDSAYRAALANIKAETQRDVRDKLIRLLPRGSDPSALSVTTYTPLVTGAEVPEAAPTATSELPLDAWLAYGQEHWKIGTGATICGLCFLWLVFRSRPRAPIAAIKPLSTTTSAGESADLDSDDQLSPSETLPLPPVAAPHTAVLDKLAELERGSPILPLPRENLFAFLDELSANAAAVMLESEHPQTIALVATALAPAHAANILHSLPESLRWDVTQRLSRIGTAAPDVLCEVAASLKSRIQKQAAAERSNFHRDNKTSHSSNSLVSSTTEPAAWPIKFDDLRTLDIKSLATVLESADLRACAVALLDRSEAFKQGLLGKMPKNIASPIRQHLKNLGPVRLLEISAAQDAIAGVAWNLAQNGMIALPPHLEHVA